MSETLYELTGPQMNIYLREQAYDKTPINVVCFSSYINKDVDIEICQKAINEIIKCNDSLRFRIIKNEDGIFQKLEKYEYENIPVIDCSNKTVEEIRKEIDIDTNIPFTPFENSKLYKFTIYKMSNNHIVLSFKMHHIISDGWGASIIFKQFNTFYYLLSNNLDLINFPSYLNYIDTEKEYLNGNSFIRDKKYWENYLKNIPEMVSFKENILKKGSKTIKYGEGLSLELSEKINEYCRENKITPYVFFVALHAIYLYKTVGKYDFMVGTPLLNRKNISEKNILGMFVSTFPLRFHLNDDMNISELFDKIHTDTFGALKHQRYPYSAILNYAKNIEHVETNLFDTIVSFQNAHAASDYLDYDKDIEWHLPGHQQSSFELHVTDHNNAGIYYLSLSFSEGIVSQDEAKLVYLRFVEMINYIISHKTTTLQEISYIPKKELDTILHQFNGEYKYKPTKTLIELFEEQAKKTPNSIALKYKDDELTYKELSEKVYNFAVYLKAKGVKPNEGVTLLIHRSLEMVVAMLTVLKCGAYYLPVDPYWPADRVKFIIKDSNSRFLVTNERYLDTFKDDATCINVDNILSLPDGDKNVEFKYDVNSLAYTIYTSGTTGKPKGILTSNYNIVYLLNSTKNRLVQDENDIWVLFHTYTFDFSTWEVYASLLFGGKLVIVPKETTLSPKEFLKLLVKEKVTILNQTPAYFYKVIEEEKALNLSPDDLSLRAILVGGEAVYAKPFRYWKEKYPKTTLLEPYGPTESTIFATLCEITDSDIENNETYIGYPLQNYHVYILDKKGNILPIGCDGEISIAGGGLCRGYLNKPELTAEKFVYNENVGEVIYKSGDLGFFATDGRVRYIGRNDNQVKIRGFRVEIGEIEKEILACGKISKVLVLPVENKNMTKSLVGFIETSEPNYTEEVTTKLRQKLTPYMIPKLYQFEVFPLNDNGKIDRKKLLAEIANVDDKKEIVAPKTDLEKEIYEVVCSLMNRKDISIDDDFFDDLGLDSLNIMELTIKLSKYNLEIQDINNASNIKDLAEKIETHSENTNYSNVIEQVDIINKHVDYDLSNVLLTGTTGFLGIHLLRELCENPNVKKVYCLIRKKNNKDANERIQISLQNYFSNDVIEKIKDKIVAVEGNFENKNLDFADEVYSKLCKEVTTVIHCGANVKHYGKYSTFYRANVLGTKHIIEFCKNSKAKLAHISTVSVGGYSKVGTAVVLNENNINVGQDFRNHVYMITKYQAECEVLKAINSDEIEGKIFRLGNIMPRFSDGKFQTNFLENAFMSRIKTILKYGEITDGYLKMIIDISPVDLCAKSIVSILCDNNSQRIYHIYNNNNFSIKELLSMLNISVKISSKNDLIEKLKSSEDPFDAHMLNDLINAEYIETPVDNSLTIHLLLNNGFKWPVLKKNYLKYILDKD